MAGNILQKFGTNGQTLTCSLAPAGTGLANNGARESTVVDNSTTLYNDVLVFIKIKAGAASTVATGYINIYAYGTVNNGTSYSDNVTGTDAAITLVVPPNLRLIGIMNVVANATTYNSPVMSVAAAFGGVMPEKWGIVIENKCGGALDTTEGNHAKLWQGVYGSYT